MSRWWVHKAWTNALNTGEGSLPVVLVFGQIRRPYSAPMELKTDIRKAQNINKVERNPKQKVEVNCFVTLSQDRPKRNHRDHQQSLHVYGILTWSFLPCVKQTPWEFTASDNAIFLKKLRKRTHFWSPMWAFQDVKKHNNPVSWISM